MDNYALIDCFEEAGRQGYITDLINNAECNSMCETCPAAVACEELSTNAEGDKEYSLFVKNFKRLLESTGYLKETKDA